MAQLKDLVVSGSSRFIGPVYTSTLLITSILAPTTSNGTTYSAGTDGYVLKSNGNSVYWASDNNSTGYLPLTGGTLTGSVTIGVEGWAKLLILNRPNNGSNWGPSIVFLASGTGSGALTMTGNKLYVSDAGGSSRYIVLDENNYSTYAAPKAHASTTTSYGVGTTANYGHVKLASGDLSGQSSYNDGIAAAAYHTHDDYITGYTYRPILINGSTFLSSAITSSDFQLSAGSGVTLTTGANGLVTIAATGGGGGGDGFRAIKVNNTEILSTSNTTALNLNAGHGINLTSDNSGNVTIKNEIPIVIGNTSGTDGTWTGSLDGLTAYTDGLLIFYKIGRAGASTTTLNINSLGAKTVYRAGSTKLGTQYAVNNIILLIYNANLNSGSWMVVNDYDANQTDRFLNNYMTVYVAEQLYRYKLVALDQDNRLVPLVKTNQTSATLVDKTQTAKSFRPNTLMYYGSSTAKAAGAEIANGTLFTAFGSLTTAPYTFNTAIAAHRAVYLKGNYNHKTGLFTLDLSSHTSWYIQVPTNTANLDLSAYFASGYYYILVGYSYTSNNMCFLGENPLSFFDGTNLINIQNIDVFTGNSDNSIAHPVYKIDSILQGPITISSAGKIEAMPCTKKGTIIWYDGTSWVNLDPPAGLDEHVLTISSAKVVYWA